MNEIGPVLPALSYAEGRALVLKHLATVLRADLSLDASVDEDFAGYEARSLLIERLKPFIVLPFQAEPPSARALFSALREAVLTIEAFGKSTMHQFPPTLYRVDGSFDSLYLQGELLEIYESVHAQIRKPGPPRNWAPPEDRKARSALTVEQCYERARGDILGAFGIDPKSQNAGFFDKGVSGVLMGFVATRHAAAHKEKFRLYQKPVVIYRSGQRGGLAPYDVLSGQLADCLYDVLRMAIPVRQKADTELSNEIKAVVETLDTDMVEWATGRTQKSPRER